MIAQRSRMRMGSRRALKTLLGRAGYVCGHPRVATRRNPRAASGKRKLRRGINDNCAFVPGFAWLKIQGSRPNISETSDVCAHLRALFHLAFTTLRPPSPSPGTRYSLMIFTVCFFFFFFVSLLSVSFSADRGMECANALPTTRRYPFFGHGCTFSH